MLVEKGYEPALIDMIIGRGAPARVLRARHAGRLLPRRSRSW